MSIPLRTSSLRANPPYKRTRVNSKQSLCPHSRVSSGSRPLVFDDGKEYDHGPEPLRNVPDKRLLGKLDQHPYNYLESEQGLILVLVYEVRPKIHFNDDYLRDEDHVTYLQNYGNTTSSNSPLVTFGSGKGGVAISPKRTAYVCSEPGRRVRSKHKFCR